MTSLSGIAEKDLFHAEIFSYDAILFKTQKHHAEKMYAGFLGKQN